MVYVVHQRRVNDWQNYDEDKVLAGFMSEDDAKAAFLACYSDPRFLGPITAMPVDEFVTKVRATKDKPAMIKSDFGTLHLMFFKSRVGPYLRRGKLVNLTGYDGRTARAEKAPGQQSLFAEQPTPGPAKPNPYKDKDPELDTQDLFTGKTKREAPPVVEPRDELIQEHKRLVAVLRSPSHQDDLEEAEKQEEELEEYEGGEHTAKQQS